MALATPSPTVSVIITTYNYDRFLDQSIASVLAQTRRPDEILVVDDGSTDETAATVARYAPAGVRYIVQAHRGGNAARNRGLRESRGALVAFLDADDWWAPDKLARQLAHLARYPAAGLITGGEWEVHAGRPPARVARKPVGAANLYPRLLVENCLGNTSLPLIRRACFARVGGFDEGLALGQDWDMWLRIARAFPVGVVGGAPLLYFRRHAGSTTAGRVWARFESNRAFQRHYLAPVQPLWYRLWLLRAAEAMNAFYAAAALVDDPRQRGVARRLAWRAALLDPLYEPQQKAGVLFRALFGRAAFDRMRGLLPRQG
jgi:glycosyltransferase involved in cell wall biosynthesis